MNFLAKSISAFRNSLSGTKIDFMRFHKIALILSVMAIIVSIALVIFRGLNFGIDFAGGILIEVRIKEQVDISEMRKAITEVVKDAQIQNVDQQDYLIRVAKSSQDQTVIIKNIQNLLQSKYSDVEYRKLDYVGPQVGRELIFKGIMALLLSFIFIMIYIWVRFDWQFGIGGIFALIHDAFLTLGFFAITQLEFNLTSIASILTIIGYSINDSVVIYDRIRENLHRYKKTSLTDLINSSTNSTLSRTILTASATLVSLLALIFYGGEVLFSFSMATFFGIVIGTYSSIYISAPILLYFDPRKKEKK
ncbi:protein translocase subunit SecF [Alphaproteobacteria bacterium]|nr:protein translocase subunit SecF [Alphaproteobacteria bacterium]